MSGCAEELRRFLDAAPTDRLEARIRRLVDQIMEPEYRRIVDLVKSGVSTQQIEAQTPLTHEDMSRRVLELMELAVTERAEEISWPQEITPTTLRMVMREMQRAKVPPMEDDPLKRQSLRMVLWPSGLIDHNAFVTVTKETSGGWGKCLGYAARPCPNCGRLRLERYENGNEVCEKCGWCPQISEYVDREMMYGEEEAP